ncbi:hypothetical protein [Aneurinibacillus tyrosinisolvens]|uniref:hypothetical protein n=1 Tax=Aneurinibacillus tyrosinisolvens TaxID=1443435 RepID=UPI00063EE902|nr:hypothetical protein [Aneurinibacillus tyrosinisolvens]
MARLPLTDVEGSPFRKAFANSPELLGAFEQMESALGEILEPELLELIRLRSAANNGCDY